MSLPEVLLWEQLRKLQLNDLRFRRQHPLGRYVLDFYCASARVAVEVDGAHHDVPSGIVRDRIRDEWIRSQDIEVLRIPATDILDRHAFEGALRQIAETCRTRLPEGGQAGSEQEGFAPPANVEIAPPPTLRATSPASQGRIAAAANPPPFTGEGDHAEHGGGGVRR